MLRREISGFLLVGLAGALIDFLFFNMLLFTELSSFTANVISVFIASIFVFFGNLSISFGHVAVGSRRKTAGKFFIVTGFTFLTTNILVWIGLQIFGDNSTLVANLIKACAVGVLLIVRFTLLKRYVYTS